MTSQQLYNTAAALMFSDEPGEYFQYYQPVLNLLLAENYWLNNALRAAEGKDLLPVPPIIRAPDEEIGYEPIMERQILPYGIAGYLLGEDDPVTASAYKNKYEEERRLIGRAKYVDYREDIL